MSSEKMVVVQLDCHPRESGDLEIPASAGMTNCTITEKIDYWKKAEEYGIDMFLLEFNLKKPVMERVLEHQKALDLFLEAQKSGQRHYAKLRNTHQKS